MAKHLNFVERGVLYRLRMEGKGQAEIARVLGRHPSTICRELQRNTGGRGYRPQQAQRKADERRLQCRRPRKMDDPRVKAYVQRRLNWFWSPDQIAHRAGVRLFARSGLPTFAPNHLQLDRATGRPPRVEAMSATRWPPVGADKTRATPCVCVDRGTSEDCGRSPTLWRLGRRHRGGQRPAQRSADCRGT